jgi:hypothetical protein
MCEVVDRIHVAQKSDMKGGSYENNSELPGFKKRPTDLLILEWLPRMTVTHGLGIFFVTS